jgi:hypothetical protein
MADQEEKTAAPSLEMMLDAVSIFTTEQDDSAAPTIPPSEYDKSKLFFVECARSTVLEWLNSLPESERKGMEPIIKRLYRDVLAENQA